MSALLQSTWKFVAICHYSEQAFKDKICIFKTKPFGPIALNEYHRIRVD